MVLANLADLLGSGVLAGEPLGDQAEGVAVVADRGGSTASGSQFVDVLREDWIQVLQVSGLLSRNSAMRAVHR